MKNALADSDKRGGAATSALILRIIYGDVSVELSGHCDSFFTFWTTHINCDRETFKQNTFFFYKKLILKLALPSCSVGSGNTAMTLLSLSFLWVWENDPWGGACLHLQHDSCWDSLKSPTFVHSIRIGQPLLSEFMWLWKRKSTRKPVAPFIMWRKWNQ